MRNNMITAENTIGIAVDKKTMNEFMKGKRNSISIELNDDNAPEFVEFIKQGGVGGYVLNVEEPPVRYHGCYFHNGGVFPYIVKKSLENIMLVAGETRIVGKIVNTAVEEAVLDEKGKVAPDRLEALVFDQFQHGYYAVGEKVGKAWNAGAALMKK